MLFLKNLVFVILVPGVAAVAVPVWLGGPDCGGWPLLRAVSVIPFVLGAAVAGKCVWDFAVTGRGTPAPIDPPKVLVVRGLYRFVRNPMYVGVLLVILGWALYFASLRIVIYGALLWLGFHLFVVLYEEPHLSRRFPGSYDEYRAETPRWLPRLPKHTP
ncbi:MAG: isoprenylcysteine carboxylmethyltransferase family protein [Deltaproteobacteria bacterium]|nr:isoprenylcysteine carboxylmethyltransferase family protein [Deltaproteobacteria bacterium]